MGLFSYSSVKSSIIREIKNSPSFLSLAKTKHEKKIFEFFLTRIKLASVFIKKTTDFPVKLFFSNEFSMKYRRFTEGRQKTSDSELQNASYLKYTLIIRFISVLIFFLTKIFQSCWETENMPPVRCQQIPRGAAQPEVRGSHGRGGLLHIRSV